MSLWRKKAAKTEDETLEQGSGGEAVEEIVLTPHKATPSRNPIFNVLEAEAQEKARYEQDVYMKDVAFPLLGGAAGILRLCVIGSVAFIIFMAFAEMYAPGTIKSFMKEAGNTIKDGFKTVRNFF